MATPKQLEANRRNAQKSTGPRTPEGKAASASNSLQHGLHADSMLIFNERREDLEELIEEYEDLYSPAGPVERQLVDTLIRLDWLSRRYHRIQSEIMDDRHFQLGGKLDSYLATGQVYLHDATQANALTKVFRKINQSERSYRATVELLKRTQFERRSAKSGQTAPSGPAPEPVYPLAACPMPGSAGQQPAPPPC